MKIKSNFQNLFIIEIFQVLSAFECPVCMDYMMPPYLQCQSGHLVCGNCRPKLTCCPTCRGPVRKFPVQYF